MNAPTIGATVHYVSHGSPVLPSGHQIHQPACRAAIVTETGHCLDDTILSLAVLNPTGLFFDRKVKHSADREGGTWHEACGGGDEPVTPEQVNQGEKSINDYRRFREVSEREQQAQQQPLPVEFLTRLNLQPDEVLAITYGRANLTSMQRAECQRNLTEWLAAVGMPVAGVLVLPAGSSIGAIRKADPITSDTN